MVNKKYIFFDIDGTILTSEGNVPKSTKMALKKAQDKGHEVFINTGRSRNIIPEVLLGLSFDGLLCGTGSYAEYHGDVIFHQKFTKTQIDKVIEISEQNNTNIIMSTRTECVMPTKDLAIFVELFSNGKIKAEDFRGVEDIDDDSLLETMKPIIVDDDLSSYSKKYKDVSDFIYINSPLTVDEFNEVLGPDINVGKASFKKPDDYSGEITLANCSKGLGIEKLLKCINANMQDSVAIGDGFNDVDMLKTASLSIAMGNSPEEVKALSDYVTDDIDKDGVYNALQQFELI